MRILIGLLLSTFLACTSSATPAPAPAPSPTASPAPSATPVVACQSDADCRLFSNYCGGCACTPLTQSEAEPECPSDPVQCLLDPCQGKTAACTNGLCAVAGGPSQQ